MKYTDSKHLGLGVRGHPKALSILWVTYKLRNIILDVKCTLNEWVIDLLLLWYISGPYKNKWLVLNMCCWWWASYSTFWDTSLASGHISQAWECYFNLIFSHSRFKSQEFSFNNGRELNLVTSFLTFLQEPKLKSVVPVYTSW